MRQDAEEHCLLADLLYNSSQMEQTSRQRQKSWRNLGMGNENPEHEQVALIFCVHKVARACRISP